jgi:hypothetical protein
VLFVRVSGGFLDRIRVTLRGRNALLHVFELWIGLAGVISGIVFFYRPASIDQDALTQTIGRTPSAIWIVSYMVAGAIIWFGLLRPSPRWETAGLWLLGAATSINGIAILDIFGWRGVATASTLLALTAAAWLRALIVQADTLRLAAKFEDTRGGIRGSSPG